MSVLEFIDSTYTDYECDLDQSNNYSFDFDPVGSRKRTNSELPEAKRQRLDLDGCEYYDDDFLEILNNAIKPEESTDMSSFPEEKEHIPLKENTSQNLDVADALNNTIGQSLTDSEVSGEKSNSGSTGNQIRQLKVIGRPLREKPQEPKKIKKPAVPNYEKPKEEVAVQQQEILKEPLTVQPKNITLSLKMVEVNKVQDPNPFIPSNIIGDIKPQQLKLKCIESQTPILVAGPQPQNKVIIKPWQPTIQMAQNHVVNIPRQTQGALSAPHSVKETIVFNPSQMISKKVQKENLYSPNLAMPCKNLKIVSMTPQKILQVSGVCGQPTVQQVVQQPVQRIVKNLVTKHRVVLKPNPNLPPRPQKVFTLVPYQSARRSSEASTGKTSASRKIILKTRNEEDIVSAEDFARFISGRGL